MTDRADIPIEELVDTAISARLLDLHTAMPGKVKSYDASTHCADVVPVVKRARVVEDGSIAYDELPVIPNVKVGWIAAGGFELHLPLAPGDSVLLVFAEVDTQQWEVSGEVSQPLWLERHGLGAPIAYPFGRTATAATGAQLVAPSPFVIGDAAAAQFVALANLVSARLDAIQAKFDAHTHPVPGVTVGPGATVSSVTATLIGPLAPVAAGKLKAS